MSAPPASFRLFVSGPGVRTDAAERAVRAACERRYGSDYELRVTDVEEQPEVEIDAGVFLTPTLIRISPGPEKRWIGEFADTDALTHALGGDRG